jgi:hypothetical protein
MGCDDIMGDTYVENMSSLVDRFPSASYFQPAVSVIGSNGAEFMPLADRLKSVLRPKAQGPTLLEGEMLAASLLRGNWTYFPSICWRRDQLVAHGFTESYSVVLDLALQLDIVLSGGSLALDTSETFLYRRHGASVSSWTASDGTRFREESALFRSAAERCAKVGWHDAERAARRHWTSRLNAATHIPGALSHLDWKGASTLFDHVLR